MGKAYDVKGAARFAPQTGSFAATLDIKAPMRIPKTNSKMTGIGKIRGKVKRKHPSRGEGCWGV